MSQESPTLCPPCCCCSSSSPFSFYRVYIRACVCLGMPKEGARSPEAGVQAIVSHLTQVSGTKFQSSARVVTITISPTQPLSGCLCGALCCSCRGLAQAYRGSKPWLAAPCLL